MYQYKYINPCWISQFLTSWYQLGGNTNETMHSWIKDTFNWMKKQLMGLNRVPGYQQIKKISYNFMKSSKWMNNENIIHHYGDFNHELNDKLYYLISKFISLDSLREKLLDNFDGCGLLYFPDTEKIRSRLFNDFNSDECIDQKSWMKSKDYDKLIDLVNEYELSQKDNTANNIWSELLQNDALLNVWLKTLKHRVTKKQIENFVNGYWRDDVTDDEYDSYDSTDDEDVDALLNGLDKDDSKMNNDDEKLSNIYTIHITNIYYIYITNIYYIYLDVYTNLNMNVTMYRHIYLIIIYLKKQVMMILNHLSKLVLVILVLKQDMLKKKIVQNNNLIDYLNICVLMIFFQIMKMK